MTKIEIIFEVGAFEPTEEFQEQLHSLGYDCLTMEARMNKKMIQWLKENMNCNIDGIPVYKGAFNVNYRVGFSGCLLIIPVDITKNWRLVPYGNRDLVKVEYVTVCKDGFGMVALIPTGEYEFPIRKEAVSQD